MKKPRYTRNFTESACLSHWQKLRSLLADDPDQEPLTRLKRRTFLPAEVNKIYQALGQP